MLAHTFLHKCCVCSIFAQQSWRGDIFASHQVVGAYSSSPLLTVYRYIILQLLLVILYVNKVLFLLMLSSTLIL